MSSSDHSQREAEETGELPWRAVHELVGTVLAEAESRGLRVAVALTDRWGRRLAFQRRPGTMVVSSDVAPAKALTAWSFDTPTSVLVETISRHDQQEVSRVSQGLVFAGGGFPIRSAGFLLGGIGVSGATSEEDAELALHALAAGGFDTAFDAA